MRGRSIGFIAINVVVSAGVALGLLQVLPSGDNSTSIQIATVEIRVTTTPDPDGDSTRIASAVDGTVSAQLATFEATGAAQVDLPPGLLDDDENTGSASADVANAQVANEDVNLQSTASALPDGCVLHVIEEGDAPFIVAEEYGANGFTLMAINGLTEEDAVNLQIGDVIIVPLANCPVEEFLDPTETPSTTPTATQTPSDTPEVSPTLTSTRTVTPTETSEATDEATETETPEVTETPTLTATVTDEPTATPTRTPVLAPTAITAQVEIVEVISVGDITAEGIRIINNGAVVDITGWTLTDAQGNEFVMPEQRLFTNGSITIFTRAGDNTPIQLFWGRSTPVWGEPDDVATLTDADGNVQSSVRIGAE